MSEKANEGVLVIPREEIYNSPKYHPHKSLYNHQEKRLCSIFISYGVAFTHTHTHTYEKFCLFHKN
jgi:hypothetical protein